MTGATRGDPPSPRVSVIIPCFNLGAFLADAVDSVLAQTFQDLEILIVDDGSTDPETQRLLDGYTRPRTRVFRTPNSGLAAARNFLIGQARGEYLCALDADDKLHPRYLEATVAALDADASLTFVSTHLRMFGDEDRVWPDTARCDLPALLADDTVITPSDDRRSSRSEATTRRCPTRATRTGTCG
jgi:glycosyltransferase involved in cell wall biosynthesis